MKPLVTILSPVYNGEKYIERFLLSILDQDYSNIELILVNDGSTDNTSSIVEKYKDKLNDKLSNFKYIKQDNLGASGALNNGLKYVKGKYLTWPDSDDKLTPNSISMKVDFLEQNLEYGYVRTEALAYSESDLSKPIYRIKRNDNNNKKENLFYDFLFDKGIYYCDGCYMTRTDSFKKSNGGMSIYISRWGQNFQMLLPISYYEKCGYINKVGYIYYERSNSHSHNQKNYIEYINKYNGYEDIILNVLNNMDIENKINLINKVKIKYSKIRLEYSAKYNKVKEFDREYAYLKDMKSLSLKYKIYNLFNNKKNIFKLFLNLNKLVKFPNKCIRKVKKVVLKSERF